MILRATVELGSGIFADVLVQKSAAARVGIREVRNVVDIARNKDKLAFTRLLLNYERSIKNRKGKKQHIQVSQSTTGNESTVAGQMIRSCSF